MKVRQCGSRRASFPISGGHAQRVNHTIGKTRDDGGHHTERRLGRTARTFFVSGRAAAHRSRSGNNLRSDRSLPFHLCRPAHRGITGTDSSELGLVDCSYRRIGPADAARDRLEPDVHLGGIELRLRLRDRIHSPTRGANARRVGPRNLCGVSAARRNSHPGAACAAERGLAARGAQRSAAATPDPRRIIRPSTRFDLRDNATADNSRHVPPHAIPLRVECSRTDRTFVRREAVQALRAFLHLFALNTADDGSLRGGVVRKHARSFLRYCQRPQLNGAIMRRRRDPYTDSIF